MPRSAKPSAAIVYDLASLRATAAELGMKVVDCPSDVPFPSFTRPILIHDRAGLTELATACGRDLADA